MFAAIQSMKKPIVVDSSPKGRKAPPVPRTDFLVTEVIRFYGVVPMSQHRIRLQKARESN